MEISLLLRLPVGRGGVLNSPRFCFIFFRCRKSGHRSWVISLAFFCCLAHCYTSFKLNPFYSRIVQQNRHSNMYTKISKRKQGSPCKIFTKDALKRQILTDSIAKNYCLILCRGKHIV